MVTPWVLQELYQADILQPTWAVGWVALRERFYVCELSDGRERLIAKCLRPGSAPRNARLLANEFEKLQRLATCPEIAGLAPQTRGRLPEKGIWLQQSLPGVPLSSQRLLSTAQIQTRVLGCLQMLAELTLSRPLTRSQLLRDLRFVSDTEPHYLMATEAAAVLDGRVVSVLTHNDLNPTNVLMQGDRPHFVDWTFAGARGIPSFDWFDLVCYSVRDRLSGWQEVESQLGVSESRLRDLLLQGAVKLVGSRDLADPLLDLYMATRLRNLAVRYDGLPRAANF